MFWFVIDFSFFHYTLTWLIRCGFDLLCPIFASGSIFPFVYPCVCTYTIWEWITTAYRILLKNRLSCRTQFRIIFFIFLIYSHLYWIIFESYIYINSSSDVCTRIVSSSSNVHKRSINTLGWGVSVEVY